MHHGVVSERRGQKVHAQIAPDAGSQPILDLLVRLAAAQLGVDLDRDQLGHPKAQSPASSPATTSATRPLRPWPAPRNFTTYIPSSSASTRPGSEPPSRSAVT